MAQHRLGQHDEGVLRVFTMLTPLKADSDGALVITALTWPTIGVALPRRRGVDYQTLVKREQRRRVQ